MKKGGNIVTAILPYIVAYAVQLIISFGFMFIYGLTAHEGSIQTIAYNLPSDLAIGISVITALVNLLIFGLWYKKINLEGTNGNVKNKINLKRLLGIVLAGVGIQVTLSFILNLVSNLFPEAFQNYHEVVTQLGGGATILSALYIGVIGPFSEEFIFRGVILKKAQKVMPFIGANILQAFLFGVYHGNLVQGTYAFILGMVLGYVCFKLQSIIVSVLLHMVINISGVLFGYIDSDKLPSSNLVLIPLAAIALAALIVGMIMLLKNEKSSGNMY